MMDTHNNHNDIPWPLIEAAIQGELTSEDKLQLESWLMESPANRVNFERLERVWKEGVADYPSYLAADETRAWNEMQALMGPGPTPRIADELRTEGSPGTAEGRPGAFVVRSIAWRRWTVAAAALLVIVGGAELWRSSRNGGGGSTSYETAMAEQRTVILGDGSRVVMEPRTRITVEGGRVHLAEGKAAFAVVHQQDRPFEVVMDGATVKDIGTRFIISKTADSIGVVVTEGKVAYTNRITGESRDLTAGSAVVQLMSAGHRGEIKTADLRFDNAKLSEVVTAVQEWFGKKIVLTDSSLGKKRITVHLDGESFDDAMKVICASLNLEYQADGDGYILKNRTTR